MSVHPGWLAPRPVASPPPAFSAVLTEAIAAAGTNRYQVSRAIGSSSATVLRYCDGSYLPSLLMLARLGHLFPDRRDDLIDAAIATVERHDDAREAVDQ